MSYTAPSAGTKVELGQNAPATQETTGNVNPESLAAESFREGGEFTANRGIRSENGSGYNEPENPSANAGTAPSYVNSQYRDSSGPHGKNLKTDGTWDASEAQDGIQKALDAEPGSENDPSRIAQQQMRLNQSRSGPDAGPKQGEVTSKTAFDALGSEVSS